MRILRTDFFPLMHQQRPTCKPSNASQRHIAPGVIWFWGLLLVVFAALLLSVASSAAILLLRVATSTSAVFGLRVLEGALAGFAVNVHPAVVAVVPFGDPRGWDLRWAVVVIGLRRVALLAIGLLLLWRVVLALTLVGVGELADEVVEERHFRWIVEGEFHLDR